MQSVTRIYNYYKKYGYQTQVMGASFRKVEQIIDLAGCDLLTISPDLLEALQKTDGEITPRLTPDVGAGLGRSEDARSTRRPIAGCTTRTRWRSRSCRDGIRRFDADARKLEQWAATAVSCRDRTA